ncbi:hypothetical protein [Thalassotalea piscium]|uniref:Uncharacterized protein n=1 Tax=Thalassotalea piscium TaxID=1230533 RepID=A0A7X0NGQ3_9GAMM|nr:hypothetical protein [Thalassotalea piscium]MBB6543050.1 hypothetical protein [Thalassotalea piscium]
MNNITPYILLLGLNLIATKVHGAHLDYLCDKHSCTVKLFSVNEITDLFWESDTDIDYINNQEIIISNSANTFVTASYKESGVDKRNTISLHKKFKMYTYGKAEFAFSNAFKRFIKLPFKEGTKLIKSSDYNIISDHIALINDSIDNVNVLVSDNGFQKKELLSTNNNYKYAYTKINIIDKELTELQTTIFGQVNTNISKRLIKSISLTANGINVPITPKGTFTFTTKQPSIQLNAVVYRPQQSPVTDMLLFSNPLISESECEFTIENNILTAFCMSDNSTIKQVAFYVDEVEYGHDGQIELVANSDNNFDFIVFKESNEIDNYQLNIDKNGEINVQKK